MYKPALRIAIVNDNGSTTVVESETRGVSEVGYDFVDGRLVYKYTYPHVSGSKIGHLRSIRITPDLKYEITIYRCSCGCGRKITINEHGLFFTDPFVEIEEEIVSVYNGWINGHWSVNSTDYDAVLKLVDEYNMITRNERNITCSAF